jgi:two-component system chemotaxis response regulator CheY
MSHVLLIEPDAVLARTYMQALQHVGHTVARAGSAQEAVNEADGKMPDLVVMELQMAMHDGVEFLQEFRSYPEWQGIPVVINTSITPAALAPVQHALQQDLGVTACLYKPRTTLQQLISTVNLHVASAA